MGVKRGQGRLSDGLMVGGGDPTDCWFNNSIRLASIRPFTEDSFDQAWLLFSKTEKLFHFLPAVTQVPPGVTDNPPHPRDRQTY